MIDLKSCSLNENQKKAAETTDGAVIIAAGPGTGKTLTFAYRVAHLINQKKVPPKNILALTFTRSAASEMKERLKKLLNFEDRQLKEMWIGTIHGICLRILREEHYPFGVGVSWSILEEDDKKKYLKELLPAKEIPKFLENLRAQKQRLKLPEEPIAQTYQKKLFESCQMDFDDLFIWTLQLFQKPGVLEKYRKLFSYILVDEFQDTSFAQYQFIQRLVSNHFCVIGDPDQAIYGFANEVFQPFEQFKKDFPEYQLLPLSDNYRSQSVIVGAAQQIINKNPAQLPRELRAQIAKGFPIEILPFETEIQEAELVVRKIEDLLGGSSYFAINSLWAKKEKESYRYGFDDIAILYRFHAQAKKIEAVLKRAGLPYRIFKKKDKAADEARTSLMDDLEDFQNGQEALEGAGISLMTLHRSKGLEFSVVFIVGCEDGILPYDTGDHQSRIEEGRRLFYVGTTRAKNRLFLCYAKKRFLFGETYDKGPSPFLSDIEEELRQIQESHSESKLKKPEQLALF